MISMLWIVSVIGTLYVADKKKLSVLGFLLLALATGPLALLIVLLMSPHQEERERTGSPLDPQRQLNDIKYSLEILHRKIANLEKQLSVPPADYAQRPAPSLTMKGAAPFMEAGAAPASAASAPVPRPLSMELDFGRNWLNKIGILVFTLGIGFLISYTFKHFGPFLKILFGYAMGGVLFYFGFKLEVQEKFKSFGRALLGGAWAIVYFTTYATHHFEASRIIANEYVAMLLLSVVVVAMIAHVLKYKSEGMMSVALFVAYFTATLGQITMFTFVSCLLLAGMVLFLVHKFQWVKTFILALILTYGIHFIWIAPKIAASVNAPAFFGIATSDRNLWTNFVFLTAYWLVFFIGSHIANTINNEKLKETLAGANFGNIALYNVLAYPIVVQLFYGHRFEFMFAAGLLYLAAALWMRTGGQQKFFLSDVVAAVFVLTFSVTLKFPELTYLLVWLIEVPFLIFTGMQFKERVYRLLGYGVAFVALVKVLAAGWLPNVTFLGITLAGKELLYLWVSMAFGLSFYLTRRLIKSNTADEFDKAFDQFFPALSAGYFALFLSKVVHKWEFAIVAAEALGLMLLSAVLKLKRFRVYSYIMLTIAFFLSFDWRYDFYNTSALVKWSIITSTLACFFVTYTVLKFIKTDQPRANISQGEEVFTFGAALVLLCHTIFSHIPDGWISLNLGIAGVLFILIGILRQDKLERLGGLGLLALTLARVFFIDLSDMDIIFKIITFIVLGILFIGASYLYTRFNLEEKETIK